jgi:diguanylate cyclase (GGDEF)-like protein
MRSRAASVQGGCSDKERYVCLATAVGARDVLVFRRVQPRRFLQIGGLGRGAGWAGNIDVHLELEPVFCQVVQSQAVHVWEPGSSRQVVGPYFATTAALVPVDHDVAVLFGSSSGPLCGTPEDLRAAAITAVQLVEEISPSKCLADELELLHAVRAVVQCRESAVEAVLHHVVAAAAEALSCEVGVVWLPERQRFAMVRRGQWLEAADEDVVDALNQLTWSDDGVCVQDSRRSSLPFPLSPEGGVRSHFVVPLGAPADGVLVLLHTEVARGFTDLCQSVGRAVAEAAGVLIHSALLREELERLLVSTRNAARLDGLTGLGNRRCWDEALATAQAAVLHGASVGVLIMDLDRLKAVNDAFGHDAGDRYLQAAARLLLDCAADSDVVARIGGDEFAVLVHSDDPHGVERLAGALRARFAFSGETDLTALSASVGYAVCPPGGDLAQTVIAADGRMYQEKARART